MNTTNTTETTVTTDKERTAELINKIKSFGYPVYLSEKGNYGFFTNADGSRIVSFQIDYFFFNFSANHKSIGLGTGYRITNDEQCLLWEIDNFCTSDFLSKLFFLLLSLPEFALQVVQKAYCG